MSHLRKCTVLIVMATSLFSVAALANHTPAQSTTGPIMLEESGQAAFGTLQEMIRHLEADPTTDWSKVDLEGLRQHLRDMSAVTLDVDVADPVVVPMGLQLLVQPRTSLAAQALSRLLSAHPAALLQDRGWTMLVSRETTGFRITTTTTNPEDVAKVRALGYIGWITSGNHHVLHHWAMATGTLSHSAHHPQ